MLRQVESPEEEGTQESQEAEASCFESADQSVARNRHYSEPKSQPEEEWPRRERKRLLKAEVETRAPA